MTLSCPRTISFLKQLKVALKKALTILYKTTLNFMSLKSSTFYCNKSVTKHLCLLLFQTFCFLVPTSIMYLLFPFKLRSDIKGWLEVSNSFHTFLQIHWNPYTKTFDFFLLTKAQITRFRQVLPEDTFPRASCPTCFHLKLFQDLFKRCLLD